MPITSSIGGAAVFIGLVAFSVCSGFLGALIYFRMAPIMVAGQVMLVMKFVIGAQLLSLWGVSQVGEASNILCMARQWGFHVSFSLTFGPIFLKVSGYVL